MTAVDLPGKSPVATDGGSTDGGGGSGGGGTCGGGSGGRLSARKKKHKIRLAVAGAVLVGAFAFLLFEGLSSSLNYFETVDQAVAQRATLGSTTFRLEGLVVPGTIHATSTGVNFTVESSGVSEPVIETGEPPQLFQPNIPVVLVGHFAGGFFASDQIIVDHSAQYIAKYPSRVRAPNGTTR